MFSIIQICLNFAAGPSEEDQDPAGYYTYYNIDNVIHVMDYLVAFERWRPTQLGLAVLG
jgi:hypothetical protein